MPSLPSSAVAGVLRPATPEHYRAPGGSTPSPPGPDTAGAGTTGAGIPRLAAFEARHSRQACQACGAMNKTTSTQMVTVAYRDTRPASVTPSLPSRYPPTATTDTQAAEPSVSHSTNASSGSPAQPAAAYTAVEAPLGRNAARATSGPAQRRPRASAMPASRAIRGLLWPSRSTIRCPQSLPAHQNTQSNRMIPGSAATTTRASCSLLSTSASAPADMIDEVEPVSSSSSTGWLAISAGVSGIVATA